MKKKLFTSKIKTLLIVAVALAIITTVAVAVSGGTTLPENVVGTVLQPLRSGVAAIDRAALRYYNYIFNYESLKEENAALKSRIMTMEDNRFAALAEQYAGAEAADLISAWVAERNNDQPNGDNVASRR